MKFNDRALDAVRSLGLAPEKFEVLKTFADRLVGRAK